MKKLRIICVLLAVVLIGCGAASWEEHYELGMKLLKDGAYQEAILEFDRAIEIDAKQAVVYVGRGHAYIGLGETEENLAKALADYEMAVSLDETNADAYLGMADVYIRRGEYDKALEILKAALAKTGNAQAIADKLAEIEAGRFKDSAGKTRRLNMHVNGKLSGYILLEYNEKGKMVKSTSYAPDGSYISSASYLYDEKDRLIKCLSSSSDGVGYYAMYEYTSDDKMSKITYYNPDNTMNEYNVAVEWDNNGNATKMVKYSSDGAATGAVCLIEYDDYGNPIGEKIINSDGETIAIAE